MLEVFLDCSAGYMYLIVFLFLYRYSPSVCTRVVARILKWRFLLTLRLSMSLQETGGKRACTLPVTYASTSVSNRVLELCLFVPHARMAMLTYGKKSCDICTVPADSAVMIAWRNGQFEVPTTHPAYTSSCAARHITLVPVLPHVLVRTLPFFARRGFPGNGNPPGYAPAYSSRVQRSSPRRNINSQETWSQC